MMEVEKEDVARVVSGLSVGNMQEGRPKEWASLQVEGSGGVVVAYIPCGILRTIEMSQVDPLEGELTGFVDLLAGVAVNGEEGRAQGFMALDNLPEGLVEGFYIKMSLESQGSGHVVCWAPSSRHLIDDP